MSKTEKTKKREQRERQAAYRKRLKEQRAPTSVDMAKVALHYLITGTSSLKSPEKMLLLETQLVKRLVKLGFDETASFALFDELLEKYVNQKYKLRRKFRTPENCPHFSSRDQSPDVINPSKAEDTV